MGEANNTGLKKTNTKFAFILNPDVVFKENTFQTVELLKTSVVGKSQQERDQDIIEGETDVEPPAKEQGPGLFAKIGETLCL